MKTKTKFTAKDIHKLLGVSRQRLHQFRLLGLLIPSAGHATQGESNIYRFKDVLLIVLILKIMKYGVALRNVKKVLPTCIHYVRTLTHGSWKQPGYNTHLQIVIGENGTIETWCLFTTPADRLPYMLLSYEDAFVVSLGKTNLRLREQANQL